MGTAAGTSIIGGIVMAAHGHALNVISDPSGGYWLGWGVFFILLPFLAVAGRIVIEVIKSGVDEAQKYKNWKAGLSPEDRRKVELAETAAVWAGGSVPSRQHAPALQGEPGQAPRQRAGRGAAEQRARRHEARHGYPRAAAAGAAAAAACPDAPVRRRRHASF
jgi:Na+-transporting methylmalonyl-CoA/oxaloacetate decarboxylase gamma subunit